MKKIVQVIPKGPNSILAISGVSTIFRMAQKLGLPIEYQTLSCTGTRTVQIGEFTMETDDCIQPGSEADLIIIPSVTDEPDRAIARNQDLIRWLRTMQQQGSQVVSLCTGAYLLAATGILNGQEASSHCNAIMDLRRRYPLVHWVPEKIITDHGGIYTSGGTLSSFNVLIYLLGKHYDKRIAHHIAKFIQLEYPRHSQKPFFIFANQRNHTDKKILQIQDYLEKHIDQSFTLDEIARRFGISRRSLNRKFKEATGDTPQSYMQKIKIEQAKSLLENENLSISEVVYEIGYTDGHSFRKLFKKITGLLPSEYKRRYAR